MAHLICNMSNDNVKLLYDELQEVKSDIKEMKTKIDDLNLILKIFKWIGWIITIAAAWGITNFLSKNIK